MASVARATEATYLPDATASKVVTVTKGETGAAGIAVFTQAVAIRETGPKETVARFGEVYAFSPAFLAVHRDEPTVISFRNLQPDDEHDFMLVESGRPRPHAHHAAAAAGDFYVFTFHRDGLFTFYCTMHQPDMSGQILVLAPKRG